jgi:hypothetical protein
MTRQHGVRGTAADLVPFAHVGWVIAITLNSACARRNTSPMVASATSGSRMSGEVPLRRYAPSWPRCMRETSESGEVAIRPLDRLLPTVGSATEACYCLAICPRPPDHCHRLVSETLAFATASRGRSAHFPDLAH